MGERPIRVCLVIHGTLDAVYGGGQVYVRNLARALGDVGHDVTVLEYVQGTAASERSAMRTASIADHGIRLVRLSSAGVGVQDGNERLESEIREALAEAAPDVVHAHGLKVQVARICAEMHLPCIVTAHHGGLVCPAGALLDYRDAICTRPIDLSFCAYCCVRQQALGRLWGALFLLLPSSMLLTLGLGTKKSVFIPHLSPALQTPLHVSDKRREVAELIAKATYLIAPSNAMQAALLRNGAQPDRVALIPHGIPLGNRTTLRTRSANHALRFAYVGRLSRVKGLHVLIDAFNRLDGDPELHIIGSASTKWEKRYWASVLKRVRRRGRLIQHGQLREEDCRKAVAECDVMVLPSICLEVFGLTVAEAFSIGRPVIVTNSGGSAEQVRDGIDGLVVPPNDVGALAEAMQKCIDDPEIVLNLAKNIRDPIPIERHVDALVEIYSRCMAPRA